LFGEKLRVIGAITIRFLRVKLPRVKDWKRLLLLIVGSQLVFVVLIK
jgi:hypothetical protein